MGIEQRYSRMSAKIAAACERAGRNKDSCTLLAVSKTTGLDGVASAIAAGAADFGENRPDQLVEKQAAFPQVRWHFIGNVQSRRIPDIVKGAYLIHSLWKPEHAPKIDRAARDAGKVQSVLLEVNVSGEESKGGLSPEEVTSMLKDSLALDNIRVCGLMTMAPQGEPAVAKECFAGLASLLAVLRENAFAGHEDKIEDFCQLSMGMSEDWQYAIEEGSTIVRIGRAIFSDEFEE